MTDRPIIFTAPMIRALLDRRKTATRRLLRDQPTEGMFCDRVGPTGWQWTGDGGLPRIPFKPPYAIGDRLWVRERSCDVHPLAVQDGRYSIQGQGGIPGPPPVTYRRVYRADGDVLQVWHSSKGYPYRTLDGPEGDVAAKYPTVCSEWPGRLKYQPWQPSIHMPRWASRLTLVVSEVKVERVQDISEDDARAEGLIEIRPGRWWYAPQCEQPNASGCSCASLAFSCLWDELHGAGAWRANPWVAAIGFTVHRCNIDAMGAA